MGTEKRARQKANRAQRQQQLVKAESRRRGLRIGGLVVAGVLVVLGLVWIATTVVGDDDDDTAETADTLPVTSEPVAAVECPPEDGVDEPVRSFDGPPPMCLDPDTEYRAVVTTNVGEFTIDLDADAAPETVNNFVFLARNSFFDDTTCHRIIPDFVVQCGDPTATGTGDAGYEFADELPPAGAYELGSVAMANSGPDTNGSQFFVVTGQQGVDLEPLYSLFGQVSDGFDTTVAEMSAAGSASGDPTEPIEIVSVHIVTA